MTSFNRIQKFKYYSNKDEVVSLKEYILFEDERTLEKYLVFKFHNNLEQYLHEIRFEVSQFNKDGDLIEVSLLAYDKLDVGSYEEFVPEAKMKANKLCETIRVELKYAKFERVYWENNEFITIKYTKNDFRNEVSKKDTLKEFKAPKDKLDDVSFKGKRKIKIKNITKLNLSKAPKVFLAIFSIILVGFVIATAVYHRFNTDVFTKDGFDYRILNSTDVEIVDYDDNYSSVTIPAGVFEYKVVAIAEEAFMDSEITEVKFSEAININKNAFKNCTQLTKMKGTEFVNKIYDYAFTGCSKLESVEFVNATYVGANAFKDCTKLTKASMPMATVYNCAFENAPIQSLTIATSSSTKLKDLFGTNIKEVKALKYLVVNKTYVPKGYLEGIKLTTFNNLAKNPIYANGWNE